LWSFAEKASACLAESFPEGAVSRSRWGGPEEPEKTAPIEKNTWSGSKLNEYKIKLSCLSCFDLIEFKYDEQFLGLAVNFSS
jgi:hypothetical protein